MSDNLAEMISGESNPGPVPISLDDLDFSNENEDPTDEISPPEIAVVAEENAEEPDSATGIPVISFNTWFETNVETLENIHQVRVSSSGVDPNNTIVIKIPDPKGGVDDAGNPKNTLKIFDDASITPVLNLPGSSMNVFNSGYQINYDYNDEVSIKCYGIKTGLIAVFCKTIHDKLIPYAISKVKKSDDELSLVENETDITPKLAENADIEAIQLLYKQITKHIDGLTTNGDVVEWLIDRQSEVMDINHLLQIDNVIIEILN